MAKKNDNPEKIFSDDDDAKGQNAFAALLVALAGKGDKKQAEADLNALKKKK